MGREYRIITYKDAKLRFSSPRGEVIEREFVRLRDSLEAYILRQPEFKTSLVPVKLLPDAPPVAAAMHDASILTGVGPMAAVAGAIAEAAARAAISAGADEAVVENGGDLFLSSPRAVTVGLYAGTSRLGGRLAFLVEPDRMPLSVCASSGLMGHSASLGRADLAVVVSRSGALADAAATLAGNLVRSKADLEAALESVGSIPGVMGVFLIKDDAVAMTGELPPLVKSVRAEVGRKVTRF